MKRSLVATVFLVPALSLGWLVAFPAPSSAADSGTAAQARAMLEKAVVALKANQADALAKFQRGDGGFKDRDLYVFCFGPDGTWSAHPELKGKMVKDWVDPVGKRPGEEMIKAAQEGKISETSYLWPRAGTTDPMRKVTYFTKVGNQVCGVGYYP
jgi:signal transduction histidine kinase